MQGEAGADEAHRGIVIPAARQKGIDDIGAVAKRLGLTGIGVDMVSHAITGMEKQHGRTRRLVAGAVGGDIGFKDGKPVLNRIEQSLYPLQNA
jgi:hypothetical protein